jgi:hypothetical protein
MKEYMIHIWGGAWNEDATPSIKEDLGIDEGYRYFNTKEERDIFSNKLKPYEHLGLVRDFKEGELTHKRTIAIVDFYYNGKEYNIEKDFGYEYEEESARFMFFDGNYSCDCNRSLFISRKYEEFPELDCGDLIQMISFKIEYRD